MTYDYGWDLHGTSRRVAYFEMTDICYEDEIGISACQLFYWMDLSPLGYIFVLLEQAPAHEEASVHQLLLARVTKR